MWGAGRQAGRQAFFCYFAHCAVQAPCKRRVCLKCSHVECVAEPTPSDNILYTACLHTSTEVLVTPKPLANAHSLSLLSWWCWVVQCGLKGCTPACHEPEPALSAIAWDSKAPVCSVTRVFVAYFLASVWQVEHAAGSQASFISYRVKVFAVNVCCYI